MEISKIKKKIETILDNNKAKNIVSIDLKKKSYIADYMIIASGTSSRHLQSLSENLVSELKKIGIYNCRMEGRNSNDWKLLPELAQIVVFSRKDYNKKAKKSVMMKKVKKIIFIKNKPINISSTQIRNTYYKA